MNEKYLSSSLYHPSASSKEAEITRQLSANIAKVEEYDRIESRWFSARKPQEDALDDRSKRASDEQIYVFYEAAKLARAKLDNSYRRLQASRKDDIQFDPWLDTRHFGVSHADILTHGKDLIRQNPVGVYGHMLLSTFHPIIVGAADRKLGDINFFPVTSCPTGTLRTISKQAQFPAHITNTLLDLSSLYNQSLGEVGKNFYEPSSPHFPAILEFYHELTENGTPLQMNLFTSHVLGMNPTDQRQGVYAELRDLIQKGNSSQMHEECCAIIEDSFDGLLGEEAYDLLGIEQLPQAEFDSDKYAEAHRKKNQLLKLLKDAKGIIPLTDGQYGQLELTNPEIHYQKNGAQKNILLSANIQTNDEESIPLHFKLSKDYGYSWDFLRRYNELPEIFDAIIAATDEALQEATRQITYTPTSANIPTAAPKREYIKDEIYDLRKVHRKEFREAGEGLVSRAGQAEETSNAQAELSTRRYRVVFPTDLASSLSEDIRAKAETAIAKYSEGLPNSKFIKYLSLASSEKIFRLRHDDVRVLAKLIDDTLIVTRVGMRRDIYS